MIYFQDSKDALQASVYSLNHGNVILVQTDTLFGLICDTTNTSALSKLFGIKGRQPRKSSPIFVENLEFAKEIAIFNESSEKLADYFWPGALTIVLPIRDPSNLPPSYFEATIGIRVPKNTFILKLLNIFGKPITATSANFSGLPDITSQDALMRNNISSYVQTIVLDRSSKKTIGSSTIVSCINNSMDIIREGIISKKELYLRMNSKTTI